MKKIFTLCAFLFSLCIGCGGWAPEETKQEGNVYLYFFNYTDTTIDGLRIGGTEWSTLTHNQYSDTKEIPADNFTLYLKRGGVWSPVSVLDFIGHEFEVGRTYYIFLGHTENAIFQM